MTRLSMLLLAALSPVVPALSGGASAADAVPAEAEAVGWFAGRWVVGSAEMPGFETVVADPAECGRAVTIAVAGEAVIRREGVLRDGTPDAAEFEVRAFGGAYPWWPLDGTAS